MSHPPHNISQRKLERLYNFYTPTPKSVLQRVIESINSVQKQYTYCKCLWKFLRPVKQQINNNTDRTLDVVFSRFFLSTITLRQKPKGVTHMLSLCLVMQRGMRVTPLGFCLRVIVNKKNPKSWKDDIVCSIFFVINLCVKLSAFCVVQCLHIAMKWFLYFGHVITKLFLSNHVRKIFLRFIQGVPLYIKVDKIFKKWFVFKLLVIGQFYNVV